MGGLHIEQSLLRIHGQLIEGSGLTEILTLHNFSTIGLSVITDASHIKRMCCFFEITRNFGERWIELTSLLLVG